MCLREEKEILSWAARCWVRAGCQNFVVQSVQLLNVDFSELDASVVSDLVDDNRMAAVRSMVGLPQIAEFIASDNEWHYFQNWWIKTTTTFESINQRLRSKRVNQKFCSRNVGYAVQYVILYCGFDVSYSSYGTFSFFFLCFCCCCCCCCCCWRWLWWHVNWPIFFLHFFSWIIFCFVVSFALFSALSLRSRLSRNQALPISYGLAVGSDFKNAVLHFGMLLHFRSCSGYSHAAAMLSFQLKTSWYFGFALNLS